VSIDFKWTTWHYVPEDRSLDGVCLNQMEKYKIVSVYQQSLKFTTLKAVQSELLILPFLHNISTYHSYKDYGVTSPKTKIYRKYVNMVVR
jgi:hypothetical protein